MADTRKIYVLNGPNLNMLGTREPEIYGYDTLDDIAERMEDAATRAHVVIDFRQSNHEGHLIDWLQEAHGEGAHAVILNPGGLTHTSVALHDSIKGITVPVIEVHGRGIWPNVLHAGAGSRAGTVTAVALLRVDATKLRFGANRHRRWPQLSGLDTK